MNNKKEQAEILKYDVMQQMLIDSIKSKEWHIRQVAYYEGKIIVYSNILNERLKSDKKCKGK
jgi:hypothetical protein